MFTAFGKSWDAYEFKEDARSAFLELYADPTNSALDNHCYAVIGTCLDAAVLYAPESLIEFQEIDASAKTIFPLLRKLWSIYRPDCEWSDDDDESEMGDWRVAALSAAFMVHSHTLALTQTQMMANVPRGTTEL